ncbi:MBOAT family O-acyltransferase [Clostridium septicum]|uniref:Uncharacterized protein n=1 Tax=Clostridium septicum TaxID=1504 RepID=A0ABY5AZH6_CLOSE|nr:hypothetical protein [Clostridium septicum]UEC21267.1 hypothetical protein LK444_02510 [Clostridium septicum]USS00688.1 hypothetical protein NH397_14585 [Clostridium septicum]
MKRAPRIVRYIYTMVLVMTGWVLFGSENLRQALKYISVMFGMSGNPVIDTTGLYYLYTNLILFIILCLCSTPIISRIFNNIVKRGQTKGLITAVFIDFVVIIVSVAYLISQSYNHFLYFRF